MNPGSIDTVVAAAPTATAEAATTDRRDPHEVLLIEDDLVVSRLVTHLLTRRGYTVQHAADGLRAVEILGTGRKPAVVVLDVMLPYVNGFELMSRIRSTAGWQDVPVLILTSKSNESDILRAFDSGANDYMVKPFRPEEFVARVRRLADARRAA
jgi:DNA-binding response OmpR family regulator